MLKNALILMFTLSGLVGCSRPSLDESYYMFHENMATFDSIAKQGCLTLSSSKNSYIRFNDAKYFPNVQEFKSFIALLDIIDTDITGDATAIDGKCNIIMQFFAVGLGGKGLTYNFYYNVVPDDSKLVNGENLYEIMSGEKKKVHFPLKNGWFLYIKRT